jgi:DNA-directed RNA polymerase subunit RPC12/RpoP
LKIKVECPNCGTKILARPKARTSAEQEVVDKYMKIVQGLTELGVDTSELKIGRKDGV